MTKFRVTIVPLIVLVASLLISFTASGHAQLESESPAADSLVSIPPRQLVLTFSEPIDLAGIVVTAVDERGQAVILGKPELVSGSDRAIQVSSDDFSIGSYTVSWNNRSSTDGHTLSGSYAFRVGGTDRAPAAATVEGERPPAWSVFTRWLTFLGLVPAIGLLISSWTLRRNRFAVIGAMIAVVGSLLEPVLLNSFPPNGAEGGSLLDAFRAEPNGWWIRLAGLAALLIVLALAEGLHGDFRLMIGAVGLIAVSGLALTSHAAGRESYAWAATGISFLHNASVAIWVGGLVLVVTVPLGERLHEFKRFSRLALPLAIVAVGTGLINAGFIFPSLDTVTSTDYGTVLLAKAGIVVLVGALAVWHHLTLRKSQTDLPKSMQTTLRLELIGIAIVVALASTMAMLAPPKPAQGELARLDLAMPTLAETTIDQVFVRLTIDPAKTGENVLIAYATDGPPLTVETDSTGAPKRVDHPPITTIQTMSVLLESLDLPVAPRTIDLMATGDGSFTSDGVNLSAEGWWRATVSVRQAGVAEDVESVFVLRAPDPNVSGFEESRADGSNPEAEALFTTASSQLAATEWAVYTEHLSGGNGGVEVSSQVWSNGGISITTPRLQLIRLDGKRYLFDDGGVWRVTDDSDPEGPAGWVSELEGATDFVLGGQDVISGQPTQVIHFYVPGTYLAPAYYTWWINLETGNVEQEAMISRSHYMIKTYDWSAPPPPLVAPVQS